MTRFQQKVFKTFKTGLLDHLICATHGGAFPKYKERTKAKNKIKEALELYKKVLV